MNLLTLRWSSLSTVIAAAVAGAPASAETQAAATAGSKPIVVPAPQRASVVLNQWETCIDVSLTSLVKDPRHSARAVAEAEGRCEPFSDKLRPIIAETLRGMMYGSSEQQVAEQTNIAMASLRRHIHGHAVTAAERARALAQK